MTALTLKRWNITIGQGAALCCIMGLNVLEDLDLALTTAAALKKTCASLNLPLIFKASFDKANRSSIKSFRGPGLDEGLKILAKVKAEFDLPICTDLHEPHQAEAVAEVADLVQIPAFLIRQTDLVVAAARATMAHGGLLHAKKAQFLAPWDCRSLLDKIAEAAMPDMTILCERGTMLGYNNLVVDMLAIPAMQRPGARTGNDGAVSTGGRREGVAVIAASAIAAGANGIFLEFHPEPDKAKCDGPSCLPLDGAPALLKKLKGIHEAVNG